MARQATEPGGIGSLESILGLLKSLKIRALDPDLELWRLKMKPRRAVDAHKGSVESLYTVKKRLAIFPSP